MLAASVSSARARARPNVPLERELGETRQKVPRALLPRMLQHFVRRPGLVDPASLERLVRQFITQYFLENEGAADQADFLARAQLFQGDFRAGAHFVDDLQNIKPEDIRRVAQRYIRDVKFVYIGDASRAPIRTMERY